MIGENSIGEAEKEKIRLWKRIVKIKTIKTKYYESVEI